MIVHATIPGAAATNGRPERRNYTYRGTGEDTLTGHVGEAELAQWKPDFEQWIPATARGLNAGREPRADACECGYKRGGQNCRALHRTRLETVTAEAYGSIR